MEKENEVDETTNSSVEDNNEEEISSDENTENVGQESDLSEELERERQARQQLTARAKKAEAEAKSLREKYESQKKDEEEAKSKTQETSPDIDERILKAQGMPDELLKELKVIAQVRGVDLMDAQKDSVFQVIKTDYERKQKSEEASLGASKGSGQAKPKKDFTTPGLTAEEHKELWKKSQS